MRSVNYVDLELVGIFLITVPRPLEPLKFQSYNILISVSNIDVCYSSETLDVNYLSTQVDKNARLISY